MRKIHLMWLLFVTHLSEGGGGERIRDDAVPPKIGRAAQTALPGRAPPRAHEPPSARQWGRRPPPPGRRRAPPGGATNEAPPRDRRHTRR